MHGNEIGDLTLAQGYFNYKVLSLWLQLYNTRPRTLEKKRKCGIKNFVTSIKL